MYVVKAFYTNGSSQAMHDEISLAWPAFAHTVMVGMREANLIRAEIWERPDKLVISKALRANRCPLAVFDLALVEERFSTSFREVELRRDTSI